MTVVKKVIIIITSGQLSSFYFRRFRIYFKEIRFFMVLGGNEQTDGVPHGQ